MIIFCPICKEQFEKSRNNLDLIELDNVTQIPIKCKCGGEGFINFMKLQGKDVAALQMMRNN